MILWRLLRKVMTMPNALMNKKQPCSIEPSPIQAPIITRKIRLSQFLTTDFIS